MCDGAALPVTTWEDVHRAEGKVAAACRHFLSAHSGASYSQPLAGKADALEDALTAWRRAVRDEAAVRGEQTDV